MESVERRIIAAASIVLLVTPGHKTDVLIAPGRPRDQGSFDASK
ncbi:hypothetical protein FM110_05840 [Brachybacterium nesterenkovii]|uniref:Uncharacterized protein n=1 Tax=Brachybacterium nesterenkovii TaxID=47847 RepID=A0A1X6WYA7_9MICO|nr:hypothetical protein FM110_05840 [Brachybacterium nesterenkovii]